MFCFFLWALLVQLVAGASSNYSVFHSRHWHNSIVAGDYLYIDGWGVTYWNGQGSSVGAITVDGPGDQPILLNAGVETYDQPNSLWQFTPSGNKGAWSDQTPSPSSNFTYLKRTIAGSYGDGDSNGGNLGFSFGGRETYSSVNTGGSDVPGLVVYNFTSTKWYNVSATAVSIYGTSVNGVSVFVPSWGAAGLLLLLGGRTAFLGSEGSYFGFDNITMYDPLSQRWYAQQATGDIPLSNEGACAVGIEGDNGTYEIYLYGGVADGNYVSTIDMGVVHVLSLPSFDWQVQTSKNPTYGRAQHSCNVIGKRYMMVIGGVIYSSTTSNDTMADPWPQGLGLFDLPTMEWRDSYDPNAGEYTTPEPVKSYIEQNGPYPPAWSSPNVESLFKRSARSSATTNGSTQNSTPKNGGSSSTGGSNNTGAIAGGAVGGVVEALLIGTAIWLLVRRRNKGQRGEAHRSVESSGAHRAELEVESPRQELATKERPGEMDTGVRSELDGG